MTQQTGSTSVNQAARSLLGSGILLGVGLVGALDEIFLHQLLQWHNFYVHTTASGRIISDGLFHLGSAALLLLGALRLWSQRCSISRIRSARPLAAGLLLGMGGFNLYDGIVQHKLLRLHPVREGVTNQLPYDLVFNGLALGLIVSGWLIWRGVRLDQRG